MYIIYAKGNNMVVGFGKKIKYNAMTGYPTLVNENITFPIDQVYIKDVKTVPEDLAPFGWFFDGTNFSQIEENFWNPEIVEGEVETPPILIDEAIPLEEDEITLEENFGTKEED